MELANRVLDGHFDLLGIGGLNFGNPIDWHLEPTSGIRSPLVPWKKLDSLDPSITGDKKIVWELNRHQHLLTLGRAFLLTGDDRYGAAIAAHITLWIRENPPRFGINWVSSLEIAFRCISWLWGLAQLRKWDKFSSLPLADIARSLHLQGCHIERYLSTYSSPNTHLTGEALGLYYLGTCLPEFRRAGRWRELGKAILLDQLKLHVRPDGVYFEQSSWYHRYTTDFYIHFVLLAERTGDSLPASVRERLSSLLEYLMWITSPDGTSPFLGDDDGGKLVKLDERAPNDWRATLCNGAVMFGRGDYKYVAGEFAEETRWLFGPDARNEFERIHANPPAVNSRAFVDGGFYVMRSGWSEDSNYMLVDCGPHGVMSCGHAHADALAIELTSLGSTILVDPGTFTYTGSARLRDLFRSTAMHNTLTIDGVSSSIPSGPFKWRHVANCTLHCWHDHPAFTFFEGSHDGYTRLEDPATHTRTLLFVNREYWLLLDRVDAKDEHDYAVQFHMAPGVDAAIQQKPDHLAANAALAALDIIYFEGFGTWQMADGVVSPCYAAKAAAPVGKYVARMKGPVTLMSVLFPRTLNQPQPEIRNLGPVGGRGVGLLTPQFDDFVLWSGSARPDEEFIKTDFEWTWVRRRPADCSLEKAVFVHGDHVSLQDLELSAERPLEFVTVSEKDGMLSIDISPCAGVRIRPPAGVDRITVNAGIHTLRGNRTLILSQSQVSRLAIARDEIDRCSHVRN